MVVRNERGAHDAHPVGGAPDERPADPPEPDVPDEEDLAEPAGFLANTLAALLPLAIGVGGLALALGMGLGSFSAPGPGLWPAVVCGVLVAMSLVLLVGGRRFHDAEALTRGALPVLLAVATLVALVLAMPYVGFEFPALVVAFIWLKVLGRESWLLSAVGSVLLTAALWLLFVQLFDVPLPHLV